MQGKKTKQVLNFDRNSPRRNEKWLEIGKKIVRGVVHRKSGRKFRVGPY